MKKIITTSWDDGHPLDFKISKLLQQYNLKGTFYIPYNNEENEFINEEEILQLALHHEIGGHTMNHGNLKKKSREEITNEIVNSYNWLKKLLNKEPVSFCFPQGKWNNYILKEAIKANYKIFRSTELFSTNCNGNLLPTTIQVYNHSRLTYLKHLFKRRKILRIANWTQKGSKINLTELVKQFLSEINQKGGCLHIWGHSWEIEKYNLWNEMENVFEIISNQDDFLYLENGDLHFL